MAKLTRQQKIALQQKKAEKERSVTKGVLVNQISIKKIFAQNWWFMLALIILCLGIYFNSLDNEITLVDDMQAFVFNEQVKDLGAALKSMKLQAILYALTYKFFEYNPLPLRIISVSFHIVITLLGFLIAYLLYDRKTAIIASLVFATHPINTEAVTWISGSPYLQITFFTFLSTLFFILFRKYKDKKLYLILSGISYALMIILQRSPWALMTPVVIIVIDQVFLSKKIKVDKMWWLIVFAVPLSIYLLTSFNGLYRNRVHIRSDGGSHGERVTLHTQSFKPVIQGYPYTTYLMSKLYLFPKTLSVYYDGMEVTTGLFVMMYLTFIAYVILVSFLWNKNRRLSGVFILLPVLIAPTYSPIKITWFLAERYLYAGTLFYGILLAYLIKFSEKKFPKSVVYGIFGIIIILFSIRTVLRNEDWQNTETLSFANMKASPLSVRPYNDIGGHFYYKGDIDKAIEWYEKGLEVLPSSGTGINNLGLIYLEYGPLILRHDFVAPEQDEAEAKRLYEYALKLSHEGGEPRTISYFMNKSMALKTDSVELNIAIADLYYQYELYDFARPLYERVLKMDPSNEHASAVLNKLNN